MGLYSKPALDLLGALINRDNPALKTPLNSANIMLLGGPYTTNLGTSKRNTRVLINGKTGSGITGKLEFFYDRLNLTSLFSGLPGKFVMYAPNNAKTVADLLPAINDAFGVKLEANDITTATTAVGFGYSVVPITITASASCVSYTGSFTINWARGYAGVYPESGPGNKNMLAGDLSAGYFGTVTMDEMFNASELMQEMFSGVIPAGASIIVDPAMVWLKFALDGKFVFFPSKNIASGLSWNTLDGVGAVVGTPRYPLLLERNNAQLFLPRLPRMGDTDPIDPVRGDPTSDAVRLFNNVHNGAYGTPVWDILSILDLSVFWWKNSRVGFETTAFVTGANQASINSYAKTTVNNWRPLLTLVDAKDYILPMRNLQGEIQMPVQRIDFFIDSARDPNMLLPMENIEGNLHLAFPAPFAYAPVYDTLTAMQDVSATKPIRSIVATFTATYDTRINLSTANAELDGF